VPAPAPTRVFPEPWTTTVVGAAGQPVAVTERGTVSCEPVRFTVTSSSGGDSLAWQPIDAWAGPWPVDEQWWEGGDRRPVARFQIVGVDGRAWLMRCDGDQWWTEAAYE
jgi:protein ImuB